MLLANVHALVPLLRMGRPLPQDGTEDFDVIYGATLADEGESVVVTGSTTGNFSGVNAGSTDFVAIKLNLTDGSEVWRWQVRGSLQVPDGWLLGYGIPSNTIGNRSVNYRETAGCCSSMRSFRMILIPIFLGIDLCSFHFGPCVDDTHIIATTLLYSTGVCSPACIAFLMEQERHAVCMQAMLGTQWPVHGLPTDYGQPIHPNKRSSTGTGILLNNS